MAPSRPDLPVSPGDVIDGKYRVESIVGVGGMGYVVAATHVELSQPVAIKFLLPDFAGNPEAVARFQREAQSAARIRNEHVARVFDIGRMSGLGPYLVMEYLVGSDLAAELQDWKCMSVQDAVDLLMQACEGTAEAHALGIVHRDLKPANLFIVRGRGGEPNVKLLDFGISKTLPTEGQAPVDLTATTSVMGSPSYMSPEQIRSSKLVDYRTDVWALGVILFEMLAGVTPFEADSVQGMCAAIAADPVRSLRALRSDIPEELAAVVMQCLEKDPAKRVQHVADLATAIAPFGSDAARRGAQRILRISVEGASTMLLNSPQIRTFGPPTANAWSAASPTAHRRPRAVLVFAGIAIAAVV
ncbi:MAG TPA: serine/threonine-protein kinase, partial [Polyangiaceae bacterium]|nr:serine/threonine-protein kinase [Polyangiaceae bacterium]